MTTSVVTWDLSDRLRKALRLAGVTTTEMAEYLGVSRGLISNWLNQDVEPRIGMLRLWAMRCGVPLEWLTSPDPGARQALELRLMREVFHDLHAEHPIEYPCPKCDPEGWAAWCAARDSNPEPADYWLAVAA